MKCGCNYYSFGFIIGATAVIASVTFFILDGVKLGQVSNEEDAEVRSKMKTAAIKGLIICSGSLIISAVFIYAIVKRKHKLMDPWIIFCIACLIGTLKVLIVKSIAIANGSTSATRPNIRIIVICVSAIVGEIALICFNYLLYRKMRSENRKRLANMPGSEECPSTEYTLVQADKS